MDPITLMEPKKTLVMKFGGTSVGTAMAMQGVVEIVRQARKEWPQVVVVTSALAGVTNRLLDSAAEAVQGHTYMAEESAEIFHQTHSAIAKALVQSKVDRSQVQKDIDRLIQEFLSLCQAIRILGEATPRALDAVAALGERMSFRLLTAALNSSGVPAVGVDASQLIVTDECFQAAHPDLEATIRHTRQFLSEPLENGIVPVVTGFIGATLHGVTTTLGRGGSDYTAALLGVALPAQEVWIWTDVDGVMTSDPRSVASACSIPVLSYREVAELAYYGARVLHPKTIRPVIEAGIGLQVRNTFNPAHPGTRIVADAQAHGNGKIKAVTTIRRLHLITIEGRGMLGVPGVAGRAFQAVAATGTSVPLITQASSEQSICFAVPVEATSQVIGSLERSFADEIASRDIDRVWATEEVAIVTVVGAGMRRTPGIAGRVFSALGESGVNVIAIAQGSSEVSISLVVSGPDADAAVLAVHRLIE